MTVAVVSLGINERVPFRLFHMPCCARLLCWVQRRYPDYCPNCGEHVTLKLQSGEFTRMIDDNAWLKRSGKL